MTAPVDARRAEEIARELLGVPYNLSSTNIKFVANAILDAVAEERAWLMERVCMRCGETGHRLELGLTVNGGQNAYRCPDGGFQEGGTRAEWLARNEGKT